VRSIARLFVATAAGAGLGAGAALARRHLLGASPATPVDAGGAAGSATPASPADRAPSPTRSAADVADLDAARIRLRERAAALRAEMEGRAGIQ
jgi:hypothetical protein